jgi:octaprenyl-diphosphate synthase
VIEDEVQVENMKSLGAHRYGIQIKDDLFDYTEEAIGNQLVLIKEQKMTLPLIHVLNTCTAKKIMVNQFH